MNLEKGTTLQEGKYIIEKKLGQGGFGITYLGEQVALKRKVAIKEFFMRDFCERDEETTFVTMGTKSSRETVENFRKKFKKEAENIATLNHPGIVSIYDVFKENNTVYYVMEYLSGGSLTEKVRKNGALDERIAARYIDQIAEALDYMHNCPDPDDVDSVNKMLHLDVKPSNIMLNTNGRAVLVDFGLSKRYDENGGQTSSTPLGISEGYAPLEQYEAGGMENFSPASDIYSLGATFYYLVTGQKPPKASKVLHEGLPKFPKNISLKTQYVIRQAMQPQRDHRPQDITQFCRLKEGKMRKQLHFDKNIWLGATVTVACFVFGFILYNCNGKGKQLYNEGMSYIQGDKAGWDVDKAIAKLTEAAEAGHPKAMMQLGNIYYMEDYGIEEDDKAESWYLKGAETGDLDAMVAMASFYDDDVEEEKAIKYLMPAAEKGHPLAQAIVGEYYEEGNGGLEESATEAVKWYTRSAEQGESRGMYDLAVCYMGGEGGRKDLNLAKQWMEKAAAKDYVDALEDMGRSYVYGTFTDKDYRKATKYFLKATEQGSRIAYYYLGEIEYADGNTDKAYDYYLEAAGRGHSAAQSYVGQYHFIGLGKISQNYERAFQWFKIAAESGNADGMYYMGLCYYKGLGTGENQLKAVEWWEKAANMGRFSSPFAQIDLGILYENGIVYEKNVMKAVEMYKKAADSDNANAVKAANEHLERLGYK